MFSRYGLKIFNCIPRILPTLMQPHRALSQRGAEILSTVKDIKVGSMPSFSNFIKVLRMKLTQNGVQRKWDFMKLHDSVTCVLFNTSRKVLIFVKQFRPPVFVTGGLPYSADLMTNKHEVDWSKVPLKLGMTMELCGGIIDAKLSDEEIMQKEVWEECGYDVPVQNFERIITYFGAVGIHGNKQTIYYAECTDDMDITKRGETVPEGDMIEVVEMSIPQVRELLGDVSKPIAGNCSLGMFWFLANRVPPGT